METTAQPGGSDDLVTVFQTAGGGVEETEVITVQQLLEANGIATVLVGDSPLAVGPEGAEVAELEKEAELGT